MAISIKNFYCNYKNFIELMITILVILLLCAIYGNVHQIWVVPYLRGRRLKSRFASWYREPDCPAQEIYTDIEGGKWYAFTNPVIMPAMRTISAEAAGKAADLCMTPELFAKMIQEAKEYASQGSIVEAFAVLDKMQRRTEWAAEEATLLNLSAVYFLREGEDPEVPSEYYTKEKHRIWSIDGKCRAFFLIAAFRLTNKYGEISERDILQYLMEKRVKRSRAPKLTLDNG